MPPLWTRRSFLKTALGQSLATTAVSSAGSNAATAAPADPRWVFGTMSGAAALVRTLRAEGTRCVFGIPGAQANELWDEFKEQGLDYVLVTNELSASMMADGFARATGVPGVLAIVPGPGITNALTGLGEALLDSIPLVCIVGDVARGAKYHPFQVHELPNADLLRPVCKQVFEAARVEEIPQVVRQAFAHSRAGEPGPTAVLVPYNLFAERGAVASGPMGDVAHPFDEAAFQCARQLLSRRKLRVGLYAGLGCMEARSLVQSLAEVLQAPVATSVSGKGVVDEASPFSVGWGYGPQGTRAAEHAFRDVDLVLALGVKYSEVSTAQYAIPRHRHVIHVDRNPENLGRIVPAEVCVHADAHVFLERLLECQSELRRGSDRSYWSRIAAVKRHEQAEQAKVRSKCGVDPMTFVVELRAATLPDALVYVDVTMTEHWAAEAFRVRLPRTYFNPTDNQAMGWSIPAALGGQKAFPGRQVVTITGDGCLLMTGLELATASREGLPVKFFILDDQAYHYMQTVQQSAFGRTTATVLPRLDYAGLAAGLGLAYHEIRSQAELRSGLAQALALEGPVLTRIHTDYGDRPCRWISALKGQYLDGLSTGQQLRLAGRLAGRALDRSSQLND